MTLGVTRWLHLEMSGGDPWLLPIWSAADAAVKAGKIQALGEEFGELGLHISTRLNIISSITQRISRETSDLYQAAKEHGPEHVFTETKRGYALRVDSNLKYSLIADIDALLSELNSCWELMRKLFQRIRAHIGRPIGGNNVEEVRTNVTVELKAAWGNASDWWFRWLDRQRNFVTHEGTPYLAIDVTDGQCELLVMKENLTSFVDSNKFFRFSELVEVARGFVGVKQALETHLIRLFREASIPQV